MRLPRAALLVLLGVISIPAASAQSEPDEDGDDPYAREDAFYRERAYPVRIPAGARLQALHMLDRMLQREGRATSGKSLKRNAGEAAWTLIGPQPIGTGPNPYSGRITALAVDPRNPDVVYAGAAEGGIWKTTDGGANWTPLTDTQASLATGAIVLDPSAPDTVYVGTGEGNNSGDSYYGAGILKSVDGGQSWTNLPGPFAGTTGSARIGALAIHPTKTQILLAGVGYGAPDGAGIYRSVDGGVMWVNTLPGQPGAQVIFDPGNEDVCYAAVGSKYSAQGNGIFKSTDAGVSWVELTGSGSNTLPAANVGRIALAMAPSNSLVLYAGIQESTTDKATDGTLLGMYKTADGGETWQRLTAAPNYCAAQCWYDNVIRVDPANADVVYAGGLRLYLSVNGGASWNMIGVGGNGIALHVDHHALAFSGNGERLYDGNDGGVWSTTDRATVAVNWKNLNSTLSIAQFSPSFSISAASAADAYAGTQDNQTLHYTGSAVWSEVTCGDGGWTVMDPAVASIAYSTCQNLDIRKAPPAGSGAWFPVVNGIDKTDPHQFYPPFVGDASNSLRLYFGTNRVYQTTDGAGLWRAISGDLSDGMGRVDAIAAAPSDGATVYAGTTSGRVQVTRNATQPAPDWSLRSAGLPQRAVTQIAVDSSDARTAYVTYSGFYAGTGIAGHVFKTSDYGVNWLDITGNLPEIPVNDVVIDPDIAGTLYVGTDIGVFRSGDGGQSWSTLVNGMPRVVVTGLKLHRGSRTLRAGTHGRSMWDLGVPLSGASLAPRITGETPAKVDAGSAGATVTLQGANFVGGSRVRWNGEDRPVSFALMNQIGFTLTAADVAGAGAGTITVLNPASAGGLSNAVSLAIGPAPVVAQAGVVSAAYPVSGAVAPGSIVSVDGTNLAPGPEIASAGALPFTLGGATLNVGGSLAPLYFVSPGQVNIQIPWSMAGKTQAVLTHTLGTLESTPVTVMLTAYAPTLFAVNQQGSGQGAILNAGTTAVAAPAGTILGAHPAARGDFLEIYGTGMGPLKTYQASGWPAPSSPLAETVLPVTVTVGGIAAMVTFSGLTPGTVGLYQVNAKIPDGAPVGDAIPVVVSINGVSSNAVTAAIK